MLGRIASGAIVHEETFLVGFWTSSKSIYANRVPGRCRQLGTGFSSLLGKLYQVLELAVEALVKNITRFIKDKPPKSKIDW